MKTIELPEQHVDYLKWLLNLKLNEYDAFVSATDKAIIRGILAKLT